MDHQHGQQNSDEACSIDLLYEKLGNLFQAFPPDRQEQFRQEILNHDQEIDRPGTRPGKRNLRLVVHD